VSHFYKAEQFIKHESLEAAMPYFRNNAVENLPDVGGFRPRVNHLYTAFEQSEDELRIAKLNKTLAEQAGLDFNLKFYFGDQVSMLDEDVIYSLAECYRDVFNESWGENWTVNSAMEEIKSCLKADIEKMPILTLLFKQEKVIGFCWGFVVESGDLNVVNSPFSSSQLKRHESVDIAKYWLESVGKKSKFVTMRELGVIKEYRNDKAPYLSLPLFEKAKDFDCKVIFVRTKISSKAFKWGLGIGLVPLQFFMVDGLLLMQGSLNYAVSVLSGLLEGSKRKSQHAILSNINRYLCV
jgi:hypothetical protein